MAGPPEPAASPRVEIPRFNLDPIRSLQPSPVFFEALGEEWEFPALAAMDWLTVLMRPDWSAEDLFLEFLPDGLRLVMAEELDPGDLAELGNDILAEASARYWWVAVGLVAVVQGAWHILGADMLTRRIDPAQLSLAGWLDAMTILIYEHVKPENQMMLTSKLESPPLGMEMPPEALEMSRDQFMSMMDD